MILWSGILLWYLINHSHVAPMDYTCVYLKLLIRSLSFNFFDVGNYLSKKDLCISAHKDIELNGSSDNHAIALPVRENREALSPMASMDKFWFLIILLQVNYILWRWLCGSLNGKPQNNLLNMIKFVSEAMDATWWLLWHPLQFGRVNSYSMHQTDLFALAVGSPLIEVVVWFSQEWVLI